MTATPQLRPLGEALGTEALGVDLSKPLDEATFAWIAQAFSEHPVLVFRDQDLDPSALAGFGRRFGTPQKHALMKYRHAEHPEVSWLTNVEEDGKIDWYGVKRATDWHTDSTFEDRLPLLAILHAKQVPSDKGGTMFADMVAAYAALPDARREQLAGMTALHGRQTGPGGETSCPFPAGSDPGKGSQARALPSTRQGQSPWNQPVSDYTIGLNFHSPIALVSILKG